MPAALLSGLEIRNLVEVRGRKNTQAMFGIKVIRMLQRILLEKCKHHLLKNDDSEHFLKIRQFWHAAVQEAGGSDLLNRSYLHGGNQCEEA